MMRLLGMAFGSMVQLAFLPAGLECDRDLGSWRNMPFVMLPALLTTMPSCGLSNP